MPQIRSRVKPSPDGRQEASVRENGYSPGNYAGGKPTGRYEKGELRRLRGKSGEDKGQHMLSMYMAH